MRNLEKLAVESHSTMLQGEGKAFDAQLDDMSYLKSKTSEWKDSSDEEGEEEEGEEEEEEEDAQEDGKPGEQNKKQEKKGVKEGGVRAKGCGQDVPPEGGKVNFDDLSDPSEDEDAEQDAGAEDFQTGDGAQSVVRGRTEEEGEYEEGRLVVKNLPFCTNEEELTAFFKRCV